MGRVRIYLDMEDYEKLIDILNKRGGKSLVKKIESSVEEWKSIYNNKKNSTKIALRKRIEKVKEKIKKTIEEMLENGENLTIYKISRDSKISYNTLVKKEYQEFILELLKGDVRYQEDENVRKFIDYLENKIQGRI